MFRILTYHFRRCPKPADTTYWFDTCANGTPLGKDSPSGKGLIQLNGVDYRRISLQLEHKGIVVIQNIVAIKESN